MAEEKESNVKRFGTIAIEEGFISQEQLLAAIEAQIKENVDGREHRLIGVILYEMGFLGASQIKIVLNGMLKASAAAT
ncbi:MAG: hypothetical protein ABIJ31_06450 [Pseudomonadota bacterium]